MSLPEHHKGSHLLTRAAEAISQQKAREFALVLNMMDQEAWEILTANIARANFGDLDTLCEYLITLHRGHLGKVLKDAQFNENEISQYLNILVALLEDDQRTNIWKFLSIAQLARWSNALRRKPHEQNVRPRIGLRPVTQDL